MTDVYEFDPLNPNVPALQESGRKEATTAYVRSMVWYLETMTERGRPYKDGRRPHVKIRRFSPGVPYASVRAVLDVLSDNNVVTDPVISGHIEPGKWRVSFSHYRKDSRYERVDAKDATATIIQDLVPYYEDGEGEEVDGGGNCKLRRFYTYIWDAAEVVVPEQDGMEPGVSYSVTNVQRDDETGLFDYVLVKDVSVEQHLGPYVSRSSNGMTEYTEAWYNARAIPEGLPQEGETVGEDGSVIQVSIRQNDDCTYDITKQTTKTNHVEASESCLKTTTQHRHEVTTSGEEEPVGDAPEPSNGVFYQHEARREEDGSYTNRVVETNEVTSKGHAVSKQTTLSGTRVETQHKHLPKSELDKLTEKPVRVGEVLAYAKTDGGKYDVNVTCFEVCGEMDTSFTNCKTIFQEVSVEASVKEEKGNKTASAAGGVIVNVSYDQTEYGTWRETTQEVTELPVADSQVVRQVTLDGETVQTTAKNQTLAAACAETVNEIGETLSVVKTDGGRADITKSHIDRSRFTERVLQESDEDTLYSKRHSQTCVSLSPLACVVCDGCSVTSAAGGVIHAAASCITETGSYRNSTSVTTEKPVVQASVATTKGVWKTSVQEVSCHMDNPAELGDSELGVVVNRKTEGGLYDVTKVTNTACSCEWEFVSQDNVFQQVCVEEIRGCRVLWNGGKEVGKVTVADVTVDDETGAYNGKLSTVVPLYSCRLEEGSRDFFKSSETTAVRNCSSSQACSKAVYQRGNVVVYRSTQTDVPGRYDLEWSVERAGEFGDATIQGVSGDAVVFLYKFWNSDSASPVGLNKLLNDYSGKIVAVTPNISIDRFGKWSGEYRVTVDAGGDEDQDLKGDYEDCATVYAMRPLTVDGVVYEDVWSANRVQGFKKNIGSAYTQVRCHHEPCATEICGRWEWDVQPMAPDKGYAMWHAHYTYYDNLTPVKTIQRYVNDKGKLTEKVVAWNGVWRGGKK